MIDEGYVVAIKPEKDKRLVIYNSDGEVMAETSKQKPLILHAGDEVLINVSEDRINVVQIDGEFKKVTSENTEEEDE